MKHLKKFETFKSEELNENIFQNAFGFIKQKIANWKDKFTAPFNAAIDYVNSNINKPEIQAAIVAVQNLPDSEKQKINKFIDNPDLLHSNMINADTASTATNEAFDINMDNIKKLGIKILGTSAWAIPAVMTVIRIFTEHSGPGNYTSGHGTAVFWLIATFVGIVVGVFCAAKTTPAPAPIKTTPAPAPINQ
jgi:hypothetical protein